MTKQDKRDPNEPAPTTAADQRHHPGPEPTRGPDQGGATQDDRMRRGPTERGAAQPVGREGQPDQRPAWEGHEGVTPTGRPGEGISHGEGNPVVTTTQPPDQHRSDPDPDGGDHTGRPDSGTGSDDRGNP